MSAELAESLGLIKPCLERESINLNSAVSSIIFKLPYIHKTMNAA